MPSLFWSMIVKASLFLILHIQLAHSGQHVPEVVLADDAISVLVDDCESLLVLLDLALLKHEEHIGGSTLTLLLPPLGLLGCHLSSFVGLLLVKKRSLRQADVTDMF